MDNQQERQLTQARLAMLYDCEGYITLRMIQPDKTRKTGRIVPFIGVSNTNHALIDWILTALQSIDVPCFVQWTKPHGIGKKPQGRITVQGVKRALKLLPQILPYLIAKREQAEMIIKFCNSRLDNGVELNKRFSSIAYTNQELDWALRSRELNTKGRRWEPESSETTRRIDQFREYIRTGSNDIVRSLDENLGRAAEMTVPSL